MAYGGRADTTFTYALLRDDQTYKFGYSCHPIGRMIELQRIDRCNYELISFHKGGARGERYMHFLARQDALGGEYFKKTPLTDYLAKNLPVIVQCAPTAIMHRHNSGSLSFSEMQAVLDRCGINPIPSHLSPLIKEEAA